MQSTVHHLLEHQAQQNPDAVLVIDGNKLARYGEVDAGANRVAAALLSQGIQRGDRIGLLARNSREYIEAYFERVFSNVTTELDEIMGSLGRVADSIMEGLTGWLR